MNDFEKLLTDKNWRGVTVSNLNLIFRNSLNTLPSKIESKNDNDDYYIKFLTNIASVIW